MPFVGGNVSENPLKPVLDLPGTIIKPVTDLPGTILDTGKEISGTALNNNPISSLMSGHLTTYLLLGAGIFAAVILLK